MSGYQIYLPKGWVIEIFPELYAREVSGEPILKEDKSDIPRYVRLNNEFIIHASCIHVH